MKRERERDRDRDSEEDIGASKPFRINPETSCSTNHSSAAIIPINNNNSNSNNIPNASNNNANNNDSIINKEQDRFLPIANVGRIMKKVIPGNGKISKDAKETVQECVSEFISFVTGEASDKCQREKRKTINGDDILWAIMTLGFEDYVNPLKVYLTKYRELEGEKLNVPKQQQQQRVEQRPQYEQKSDMPYSNVYTSTNLMPQPSFSSNDHPFSLPNYSQNSFHTTTRSQQDHIDENW